MEWISWVLLPVSGFLGAIIADQRSKRNTSAVVEVSRQEAATSARNAASTEFNMLTQGFTTAYELMDKKINDLTAEITRLAEANKTHAEETARQAARATLLARRLDEVMVYLEALEALVPVEARPARPIMDWRHQHDI